MQKSKSMPASTGLGFQMTNLKNKAVDIYRLILSIFVSRVVATNFKLEKLVCHDSKLHVQTEVSRFFVY